MSWLGSEHQVPLRSDPAFPVRCHRLKSPSLGDMRRLWADLPGGGVSTPFQTPEFLHAFQETHCRETDSSLWVVTFEEAGKAEAPFMLLPLASYRRGPLRVVSVPDGGLADQTAPVLGVAALAQPGRLSGMIRALFEALDDVDLVDIQKVHPQIGRADNPIYCMEGAGVESCTRCLDLTGNTQASTWRRKAIYKKTRSKFRKLREAGVELVEARTPAERLAVFQTLAAQRAERFRQLGREDSLERGERSAFYTCLAALEGADSPVRALSLERGGETVAAMILLCAGTQATAVLVSIGDPHWHGFSPGMVLFAQAIEWAAMNGCHRFSFGTGEQEYKQRFGGQEHQTRRLLLPLNARGRLFVRARDAHRSAHELLQIAVGRNRMSH